MWNSKDVHCHGVRGKDSDVCHLYRWTYAQGRNRHADVKNEFVDTARGWGWDRLTDSVDIYTVLCIN